MKKILMISAVALLVMSSCSKDEMDFEIEQKTDDQEVNLKAAYADDQQYTRPNGWFISYYRRGGDGNISYPDEKKYSGNFAMWWNNCDDIVGGKGWETGKEWRTINYNIGYLSSKNDVNFIGVYGWTKDPIIEYYICEIGNVKTNDKVWGHAVKSNGHWYGFYRAKRTNADSYYGSNKTFWQYRDQWGGASIGNNGKVSMHPHVANWKKNGGHGFGALNKGYQIFAVEAWAGQTGSFNGTIW